MGVGEESREEVEKVERTLRFLVVVEPQAQAHAKLRPNRPRGGRGYKTDEAASATLYARWA